MTDAAKPIVWMRAVRDAVPKFTMARRAVLWALGLRMRADGTGFVSMRILAEDADVDYRTARRATTDARARGYLERTRRGGRHGDRIVASDWVLVTPSQGDTAVPLSEAERRPQGDRGDGPKGTEGASQGDTPVPPRGPSTRGPNYNQEFGASTRRAPRKRDVSPNEFVDDDYDPFADPTFGEIFKGNGRRELPPGERPSIVDAEVLDDPTDF